MKWLFEDKPTIAQQRNRRAFKRWWRSFKREGELIIPFIIGIIIIGLTTLLALSEVIR
tara:strand:+ start:73 stop:246 length:174 start_codon:yes stop_codon:yes gene_type:complete